MTTQLRWDEIRWASVWVDFRERIHVATAPITERARLRVRTVCRSAAHYQHQNLRGYELRSLDRVREAGWEARIVSHSGYYRNIRPYLQHFAIERFLFVDLSASGATSNEVMAQVFRFLDLPVVVVEDVKANSGQSGSRYVSRTTALAQRTRVGAALPRDLKVRIRRGITRAHRALPSGERIELSSSQRERLGHLLRPDVLAFGEATGFDVSGWPTASS